MEPEAASVTVPLPQRETFVAVGGDGGVQVTIKSVVLVPVPANVVTEIGPVVAPVGTVTVRLVADATVGVAASTPLNFTVLLAATGSKFVPVMVTVVPMGPEIGLKDVIVGATGPAVTIKSVKLVKTVHPTLTTIFPVVAPVGTVAVIFVPDTTLKVVAGVPLKLTLVAPVRFAPVIVTIVPMGPLDGVKLMGVKLVLGMSYLNIVPQLYASTLLVMPNKEIPSEKIPTGKLNIPKSISDSKKVPSGFIL
jgi:hypothetical protein